MVSPADSASALTLARIGDQLAALLGQEVADWQREELAEKLAALPSPIRRQAMGQLPVIWPVSCALYHAFVEQVAKASSCLLPSQIAPWVKAALDVYEADGLRQAQLFLEAVETDFVCQMRGEVGMRLAEIEHRLLPYARGILGRELKFAPAETASFDTTTLFLPVESAFFVRQGHNFLFYKFTITFLLSLDRLGTFRAQAGGQSLTQFVAGFADRPLATDPLYLAEGVRIIAALHRDFPGLMADFADCGGELLTQVEVCGEEGSATRLVGELRLWLLHLALGESGFAEGVLPSAIVDGLARLRQETASLTDSLALTLALYRQTEGQGTPYRPGQPLPFMGRLTIDQAVAASQLRQEERQEKVTEALRQMIADQSKGKAEAQDLGPEDMAVEGRPPLSDEQGTLLLASPKQELDPDELRQQLAQGVLRIGGMEFELTPELEALLREMIRDGGPLPMQAIVSAAGRPGGGLAAQTKPEGDEDSTLASGPLRYDEWDFRRRGFRKHWCQVRVKAIQPVQGTFVANTLSKYRGLLLNLRRQFEMMSLQETFVRRQRDGDELDLDAVIEALSDTRAGRSSSERLFIRLQRQNRQIAALFLLDMSSSTEGWVSTALKESLILMCEALGTLGDAYAIYGFSGMRRLRSEIFMVKEFAEPYDATVKGRIAAIEPKEYTRMGPAIRHASAILAKTEARIRLLITLSDGKPEDYDGYQGVYAIEDTRHALIEAKTVGIHPFCITVDKEAHAYIPHMYGEVNSVYIDQVAQLPRRLPEIYRHLTS